MGLSQLYGELLSRTRNKQRVVPLERKLLTATSKFPEKSTEYLFAYLTEYNYILYIENNSPHNFRYRLRHSQLAYGKNVYCAGMFRTQNGKIVRLDNDSGHYKPFGECLDLTKEKMESIGVDASGMKLIPYR